MTRTAKRRPRPIHAKSDHLRVACYCRVSVAERGEQQFSSIEAQREALVSYVAGQKGLGWRIVDERYEDEGFSGGNLDRPALQRLLADARAGLIDLVAVYKYDRLSREQLDFLHTAAELARLGVEVLSITQNIDTKTSHGRCMLGVMSSFSQLERETIADRTRDKMGAARRKGMWTGGRPVLGYDVIHKKLVVNPSEAEQVRMIYQLYLDRGGVMAVVEELRLRRITNKRWITKAGVEAGGTPFDKNVLTNLLHNPLYVGAVRARDELVEGEHEVIVPQDVWDAAQRQFAAQAPRLGARGSKRSTALLAGIARCGCGAAMSRTTSKRDERTYCYYACSRSTKLGKSACSGTRVAAGKLETFVVKQLRHIGRDPSVIEAAIAADRDEREDERRRLEVELDALKVVRGRHEGERKRVVAAVGAEAAPQGLVARVGELDGLVAKADARITALSQDLAALAAPSDIEGLRAALLEFEGVWDELDQAERARVLALVLDEVVVDAVTGEAELHLRGCGP
jgi:site-specific DNA recombinase